ncbi:MAG TPA: proteasome subunit alpha [Actinomycetota bacterium]|nr:proteasome subunit alpha [Actinomycetota bacterium]
MALPYYVSPEQFMKDKSDYARKGIARGKSVIALDYADGIAFVAENPSATLHKISEIYDRMAFAGVGKFNEFETLRMHGIRQADVRGYSYSREDVNARGLANSYSQILGQIFTEAMKPFEVEILVAQVGREGESNELYQIRYDGSVEDEENFVAMGGEAEQLTAYLQEHFAPGQSAAAAVKLGASALGAVQTEAVAVSNLEVGVLDRNLARRKFRRISPAELEGMLA